MPNIIIDGQEIAFKHGETIVEAAAKAGIIIPTLCYLPKSKHGSVCRICSVSVEGYDKFLPACATHAVEGMRIISQSAELRALRKQILSMMLAEGRHDCFFHSQAISSDRKLSPYADACMATPRHHKPCPSHGDCQLKALALQHRVAIHNVAPCGGSFPVDCDDIVDDISPAHGLALSPAQLAKHFAKSSLGHVPVSPMIRRDFSRCIQCGRCASVCANIQVNEAIAHQFGQRATKEDWWPHVDYSKCTHCGDCVQACPTGALTSRKKDAYISETGLQKCEEKSVRTTCPYCGVGCQQELRVRDGRIVEVRGVEDGAPNYGSLCVKGRFGYDFIYAKDRLTDPLIRQEDGTFKKATWDEALDLIASKFKETIEQYGADAVAGLSCSRSINEDSYQMQKLFRSVFKTNNIDNCART